MARAQQAGMRTLALLSLLAVTACPGPQPALVLWAPSDLAAVADAPTAISLNWKDNSADETRFRVERSLAAAAGFVAVSEVPGGVTHFSDTGVMPGNTYYYRVLALGASGESPPSNVAS